MRHHRRCLFNLPDWRIRKNFQRMTKFGVFVEKLKLRKQIANRAVNMLMT